MFDYIAPIYDNIMNLFGPDPNEWLSKEVPSSVKVIILDVGGGTGEVISNISKTNKNIEGFIVDESKKMLKQGLSKDISGLILGRSSYLPFLENTFDMIICIDAFHHFKGKKDSLREMDRVLRSGGKIFILELNPKKIITRLIELGEKLLGESSKFFDSHQIRKYFVEKGYEVHIKKINSFQYILSAKKM